MRRIALSVSALLFIAACSSTGPADDAPSNQPPAGEVTDPNEPAAAAPAPPDVSAEAADGSARLEWQPVDGADSYRIDDGLTTVDVPATVCQPTCAVSLDPAMVAEPAGITVSSVSAAGAVSEPVTVPVEVPSDGSGEDPDGSAGGEDGALEVLLVYAGDPPEVETVPVDSPEDAQRVIDEAKEDALTDDARPLLSANVNTRAASSAATNPATATDPARDGTADATWQVEAMNVELIPGEPRGAGVTVAILEKEGVDPSHPSLSGEIDGGTYIGGQGLDGTSEPGSHAIGVASLLVGQDSGAVPGIAPGVRLLPVDVGDAGEDDLIKGIIWAVDNGADVINISLAMECASVGPLQNCPDGLRAATDYAESQGVVVVAGAGNNGGGSDICFTPTNADIWPAVIDTVISVGGYAPSGEPWACTPDRPDVDLLAPASGLLVADTGASYRIGQGTSFASPLVAGLIAAILAERPELTPADIRALLPQWRMANGRLNVAAALYSLDIIVPDELDTDDLEHATQIFPYRVDLLFEGDHPVSAALPDFVGSSSDLHSAVGYSGSAYGDREQNGRVPYGEIEGLILIDDAGEVTASGVMSFRHGETFEVGTVEQTVGPYRGHWMRCPKDIGFAPKAKVFRWDVPVTVEGSLVPGTLENPEVNLTFSLGVGATPEQAGQLPDVTVPYDTLGDCKGVMDYFASLPYADPYTEDERYSSWDELSGIWDEYYATMESVNEQLIAATPITLAEPVQPRYTQSATTDADDPRVHVIFSDAKANRPVSYD